LTRDLPDHEFIVTTALIVVRIRSGEDIIRNVRADVSGLIVPLDVGRHALDVADLEAFGELLAHVGIALHVVLSALPCPAGAPAHA